VRGEERKAREPHKYANIVRRFVEHLIDLGVASAQSPTSRQIAREKLRHDYEDYLHRQRGLSRRTIFHTWRFADRFLDYRFGDAGIDLGATSAGDVITFLQLLTSKKAPFRDTSPATHLRNFFQFMFKCGLTSSNLALCVPSVARRYDARLPRHLTLDRVEAVLAAVCANPKQWAARLCDDAVADPPSRVKQSGKATTTGGMRCSPINRSRRSGRFSWKPAQFVWDKPLLVKPTKFTNRGNPSPSCPAGT